MKDFINPTIRLQPDAIIHVGTNDFNNGIEYCGAYKKEV